MSSPTAIPSKTACSDRAMATRMFLMVRRMFFSLMPLLSLVGPCSCGAFATSGHWSDAFSELSFPASFSFVGLRDDPFCAVALKEASDIRQTSSAATNDVFATNQRTLLSNFNGLTQPCRRLLAQILHFPVRPRRHCWCSLPTPLVRCSTRTGWHCHRQWKTRHGCGRCRGGKT